MTTYLGTVHAHLKINYDQHPYSALAALHSRKTLKGHVKFNQMRPIDTPDPKIDIKE